MPTNTFPMNVSTYSVAGVIAINTVLISVDTGPYSGLSVQASSIGTTGVVTPEWSNDGTTWVTATLNTQAGGAGVTTFNAAGLWTSPILARFFRLRLSTATTGGTTTLNIYGIQNASDFPTSSQNVILASGTVTTVSTLTGGGAAEDAAAGTNPVLVGGVVRTATAPVTLVAGDVVRDTMSAGGAKVVKPYGVAETGWNANLSLTTTTAAAIAAAAGASLKRHITALQAINTGASAVDLIVLDGATERWRLTLPVNVPVAIEFPTELVTTANTALNANLSAVGTVRACFQGYTSV